jgi:opacity protein-like surface antigen
MSKKFLLATVAVAGVTLGAAAASAADVEPAPAPESASWYVSLFGGAAWLDDVDVNYDYRGDPNDAELESKTGFIVGGAIGTHLFSDDLRVEIEAAYSENKLKTIDFDGPGGDYSIDGKFGILTFMGNLWYDVPLSDEIKPYLGGGAGVAIVDGDFHYNGQDTDAFDSSEVAFAFQLGAGLRWMVSENIALDVGYRFRGIDGPTFDGGDFAGSDKYHTDWFYSHNVIAGVSLGF